MQRTTNHPPTLEMLHADPLAASSAPSALAVSPLPEQWSPADTTGPRPLDHQRQQWVVEHVTLSYRLAWRFARQRGRMLPADELIAEALFALTYAASMYQPQREVPFRIYATLVIRHRLIQMSLAWQRRQCVAHRTVSVELVPSALHTTDTTPYGTFDETLRLCAQVRQSLPEHWYEILWLYCTEGLTMEAIGQRLNVSKQRAQRIVAKAITRARTHVDGWGSVT